MSKVIRFPVERCRREAGQLMALWVTEHEARFVDVFGHLVCYELDNIDYAAGPGCHEAAGPGRHEEETP